MSECIRMQWPSQLRWLHNYWNATNDCWILMKNVLSMSMNAFTHACRLSSQNDGCEAGFCQWRSRNKAEKNVTTLSDEKFHFSWLWHPTCALSSSLIWHYSLFFLLIKELLDGNHLWFSVCVVQMGARFFIVFAYCEWNRNTWPDIICIFKVTDCTLPYCQCASTLLAGLNLIWLQTGDKFPVCVQKLTRYLLSWHFFWQNYSFSAVMYISVRTLPRRKLLNYSVESLKTRLVKWLPINKTLQNKISLDILSRSCHISWIQVWISVAFAKSKEKKKTAGKDKCKYHQSHLTNASLGCATVMELRQKTLVGGDLGCPAQLKVPFFHRNIGPISPKLTNHPSYYIRFAAVTFLRVEHETLMVADTSNTSGVL